MSGTASKLEAAARQLNKLRRQAIESDPEREKKQRDRRLRAAGHHGMIRRFIAERGAPGFW